MTDLTWFHLPFATSRVAASVAHAGSVPARSLIAVFDTRLDAKELVWSDSLGAWYRYLPAREGAGVIRVPLTLRSPVRAVGFGLHGFGAERERALVSATSLLLEADGVLGPELRLHRVRLERVLTGEM